MIDPDLKKQLEVMNTNLVRMQRAGSWWRAFTNGLLTGFGYVIGFVLALILLGWVLNLIGVIPAFRREVDGWRQLLQQTQQQKLPSIKGAATQGK
jgi:hypothetical protein